MLLVFQAKCEVYQHFTFTSASKQLLSCLFYICNEYLLSNYYVPGCVLDAGHILVNQTDKRNPIPGAQTKNKINEILMK
jgi:hypothetical protein